MYYILKGNSFTLYIVYLHFKDSYIKIFLIHSERVTKIAGIMEGIKAKY